MGAPSSCKLPCKRLRAGCMSETREERRIDGGRLLLSILERWRVLGAVQFVLLWCVLCGFKVP